MGDALPKPSVTRNFKLVAWFLPFFLRVAYICYDHHGYFQFSGFLKTQADILISLIFEGYKIHG